MRPLFLVENFFNEIQNPAHAVDASGEAPGRQAWRVATGRRHRDDRWAAAAEGEAWLRIDCGQARAADCIALDRGHNLAGRMVTLQSGADGAAWGDVASFTIPAAPAEGGDLDLADGATTDEGAWIKRFPEVSARWWRLLVPAAATVRTEVVGLWLGKGWSPGEHFDWPLADEDLELRFDEAVSAAGWRAAGPVARPRAGEILLKLHDRAEYAAAAEHHVRDQFWAARRPMWIVHDTSRAERAVLAVARPGRQGFGFRAGWGYRQARIAWIEHEPAP